MFRTQDVVTEHLRCRTWLERELAKPFAGKTVVVTHFAPSLLSLPPSIRSAPIAAWYASSLDAIVERADLWIHGRVPDTIDYSISSSRVVCNARGLPWGKHAPRRPFRPAFIVDV
ncbi:Ser/Thr protein phosphatase family protein [Paraburkholderia caribensis MBA4]|uniref:Ser/Thr protein phosphatase family protein n=1 Tax=Paraburkholderia caribensis MBA4 TaxID=1323664 RepID=A0A0P0RIF3_9BURK|nr:Ser/Thr protein phosphatase family protein [Paraburkholderia caribensis MBA4]